MSEQFSIKVNDWRHLHLVTSAEREPKAEESHVLPASCVSNLPTHGPEARGRDASSRPADLISIPARPASLSDSDLADLGYVTGELLPRIHGATHELHEAIADRNPAWVIASLRRFVALGQVAKDRADALERRLP